MKAKGSDREALIAETIITEPAAAKDGHEPLASPEVSGARAKSRKRFRWWQIPVWLGVVGLLGVLGWGVYQHGLLQPRSGQASDFTIPLYGGGQFHLADQRGKVVVVNFWASWCQPCEQEAPDMEQTWQKYRNQGVEFIGVDYVDTEPEALAYLKRLHVTYANGPDEGTRVSQAYRIQGVPETFVVDPNGQIVYFVEGPTTVDKLSSAINAALPQAKN